MAKSKANKSNNDGSDENFEITDYTLASSWETLIAEIEQTIQKSLLNQVSSSDNTVTFNSKQYQLIYITPSTPPLDTTTTTSKKSKYSQLKYNNFMNPKNDFQALTGSLIRDRNFTNQYQVDNFQNWFGLNEYFLLLPLRDNGPTLSELSMLVSGFSIALHHAQCYLPAFIGYNEKRHENFLGYMYAPISRKSSKDFFNVKLATELISQSALTSNQNISESFEKQLKIFYSKISLDPDDRNWDQFLSLSTTSTKYTYIKSQLDENKWRSSLDNFSNSNDNGNASTPKLDIVWGMPMDPIHDLQLCVMCPPLKTTHILDDGNDFSSMPTPKTWFIKSNYCRLHPSLFQLTLGTQNLFNHFIDSLESTSIQDILSYYNFRKSSNQQPINQQSNSQQQQGDPSLIKTMGSFGKSLASTLVSPSVPTEREIDYILRDLFYEAKDSNDIYHFNNIPEDDLNSPPPIDNVKTTTIKRAPIDSLFYSFCTVSLNIQSMVGIILLWNEFIQEIKWHWNNLKPIPRIFTSHHINANNCLIYQKLQLINYCIKSKILYNESQEKLNSNPNNNNNNNNNNSNNNNVQLKKSQETGWEFDDIEDLMNVDEEDSISNHIPIGIDKGKLVGQYLLYEDREIVIPLTQEPGPMTDDMVAEHINQIMELGSTVEGNEKRLELQSPGLLSDMQAFKEANPGCVYEDFIRWHSNSDWVTNPKDISILQERKHQKLIENENNNNESSELEIMDIGIDGNESFGRIRKSGYGRDGCLSARMDSSDTIWRKVWKLSKPIHVYKQVPLFDFNKQADLALEYLEVTIQPKDLLYQIVSVVLISIATIFSNEKTKSNLSIEYCLGVDFEPIKKSNEKYYESINSKWFNSLPTDNLNMIKLSQFDTIFQSLQDIEYNFSKYTSLKTKFNQLDRIIKNLYESGYSNILENEFNIVADLFFGERQDFDFDSNDLEYDITNNYQPNIKEYITRSYSPKPFKNSPMLPHKMYTSISPYECRIATCISEEDI